MKQKLFVSLLASFIISSILTLLFLSGFFNHWQQRLGDTLFLPKPYHKEIVIIAIDDASIQKLGRWPWDRRIHAKLLEKLGKNPRVVGYDVSFLEPSNTENDTAFASALEKSQRTVLAMEAIELATQKDRIVARELLSPIPEFLRHADVGLVNMVTDADGITRKIPVRVQTEEGKNITSFSESILSNLPGKQFALEEIPQEAGVMRIYYNGGNERFQMYSFYDVYIGKIPVSLLKEKIVLVGATAQNLHDTHLTPLSGQPVSGVAVHAYALQTLLDRDFLITEHKGISVLTIIGICFVMSILLTFLSVSFGTGVMFLFLFLYILYAFFSFDQGVIRNLIYPFIAIISSYVFHVIYKYSYESKQRRFIKRAFSFYISEAVMNEVLSSPEKLHLGGVRKELTVLFSDIAGFTTISEKLPPEDLTLLLNKYLTKMTDAVFARKGVLDKYIGDAVMAFWGAPIETKDHAFLACQTALQMQKEISDLKGEWEERTGIPFTARIGINTGEMAVGNMGSEMRFDYTLIGDNVNLGSRLEGVNKAYGTKIIISENTYEQVKDKVIARRIDTIIVKGKEKGIGIYELRGIGKPSQKERDFLHAFEEARVSYHEGKFQKALKKFFALQKVYPEDSVIPVYITRLEKLFKNPPTHWDGIIKFETK